MISRPLEKSQSPALYCGFYSLFHAPGIENLAEMIRNARVKLNQCIHDAWEDYQHKE
jgi:hypothetical protein